MSSYQSLADRLEAILSDVDDLAFDQLREAVADGVSARPHSDRELAKVRRSVEKAARLLRALDDGVSG